MTTEFPMHASRNPKEPADGWMTVQRMVEFLRDTFDSFVGRFARGGATVAVGGTTVVVNHGLNTSTYSAAVTPLIDPGGRFWVSGKTSSQFTINLGTAAPVGGIPFDWIAKGA